MVCFVVQKWLCDVSLQHEITIDCLFVSLENFVQKRASSVQVSYQAAIMKKLKFIVEKGDSFVYIDFQKLRIPF